MDFLYEWIFEKCEIELPEGVRGLVSSILGQYFGSNGDGQAFFKAFCVAVVVAVVFIIVYYGIFGMKLDKLATRPIYWITFVITGVVSFFATHLIIIGNESNNSGIFGYIDDFMEHSANNYPDKEALGNAVDALTEHINNWGDLVWDLCLENAAISAVIFLILSLIVKRFTHYAKVIPFEKI